MPLSQSKFQFERTTYENWSSEVVKNENSVHPRKKDNDTQLYVGISTAPVGWNLWRFHYEHRLFLFISCRNLCSYYSWHVTATSVASSSQLRLLQCTCVHSTVQSQRLALKSLLFWSGGLPQDWFSIISCWELPPSVLEVCDVYLFFLILQNLNCRIRKITPDKHSDLHRPFLLVTTQVQSVKSLYSNIWHPPRCIYRPLFKPSIGENHHQQQQQQQQEQSFSWLS